MPLRTTGATARPNPTFDRTMADALAGAFDALGQDTVNHAQEVLSIPYPPASSPGESPHMRTGALRGGVTHEVELHENGGTLTITFSRPGGNPGVPRFLEDGTDKMEARPFAEPVKQWVEMMAGMFISSHLSGIVHSVPAGTSF